MKTLLLLSLLVLAHSPSASPLFAAEVDANRDGIPEPYTPPVLFPPTGVGENIAVVEAGEVAWYQSRLTDLGYFVTPIPIGSDYSTLIDYDAVVLGVGHGDACCWATLNGLAADYHDYVRNGGCLLIGQPNPYELGGFADITWVPYDLSVNNQYYQEDPCAREILDPEHCITVGREPVEPPNSFEIVTALGPEWEVLVENPVTHDPALLFACHGTGHVVVDLGNPSPDALCTYPDAGLLQMMECCLQMGPTATGKAAWGSVKALFR